ncbi:Extradiol ring-cleavage dioxygenase, class III enzyme, subunit B [Aspergillus similis]
MGITPVHFFSHGSTMMLGEESTSADYWKKCGHEALANGIKGVVIMGAHWDCAGDKIEVAMNPKPDKSPVAFVNPKKYKDYQLVPDLETGQRCIEMLANEGFHVSGNSTFNWIHDVYLVLVRMFPAGCPPTTIISMNARYDPHFHMKIGSTLRPLRYENYLLIGTGGPNLRRAMTKLMKHPMYREAHATDDHFMAALFVAGAAGDWEDADLQAELGAESWELTNMCNSQFTIGSWKALAA